MSLNRLALQIKSLEGHLPIREIPPNFIPKKYQSLLTISKKDNPSHILGRKTRHNQHYNESMIC